MAINFQYITEAVFHVDHTIRLFTWIIIARRFHALLSASSNNLISEFFNIWVLNTKMKYAGFPILKVIFRVFLILKLKQFNPNAIANRKMRNSEMLPPGPKTSLHISPIAESSSTILEGSIIRYQPSTSV